MSQRTYGLKEQNKHPMRRYKMQALMGSAKQFSVLEVSLFAKDNLLFLGNTMLFIYSAP